MALSLDMKVLPVAARAPKCPQGRTADSCRTQKGHTGVRLTAAYTIRATRPVQDAQAALCYMYRVFRNYHRCLGLSREEKRRPFSVSRIATKLFDNVNLREPRQTRAFKNTNERQSLSQSSSIELKCDFKFDPQMLRCLTSRKETSDDGFP